MPPETTPTPSIGSKGFDVAAQRAAGLDRANRNRRRRSDEKRYISKLAPDVARAAVGRLIILCPPYLASARVVDTIKWVHRIQPREVNIIAALATIANQDRRVRELTQRQRIVISLALLGELTASEARALTEADDMIEALKTTIEHKHEADNGR